MTVLAWVVIGCTFLMIVAMRDAAGRITRKIDVLIEEVRYPNLEAQKRDLMGEKAYNEMNDIL